MKPNRKCRWLSKLSTAPEREINSAPGGGEASSSSHPPARRELLAFGVSNGWSHGSFNNLRPNNFSVVWLTVL